MDDATRIAGIISENINKRIDTLEQSFNSRIDKVETTLDAVHEQTKRTNGRVNAHDVDIALLQERNVDKDKTAERRRSRLDLRASWVVAAAAAAGALRAFGLV